MYKQGRRQGQSQEDLDRMRNQILEQHQQQMRNECEIYLKLDHPNIGRLYDVYENDEQLLVVMELCSGGELYSRLMDKTQYSESD